MITTLKETTSSQVAAKLNEIKNQQGAGVLGRVLTLIVVVSDTIDVDQAIDLSSAASREHPCRVILVVDSTLTAASHPTSEDMQSTHRSQPARLNAQIRVGGDAGASEIVVLEPLGDAAQALDTIVLPLVLPDTPVVTYWPNNCPLAPSDHPLGRLAVRRITDVRDHPVPVRALSGLAHHYQPGDTDLSWSGVTLWRAQLAAILQTLSQPLKQIMVAGHSTHPASYLVAAWLKNIVDVPVEIVTDPEAETITHVTFVLADGQEASLTRHANSSVAHQKRPEAPDLEINLPRRLTQDCLMEELRRLKPDGIYGHVVTHILPTMPEVQWQLDHV